MFCSAPFRHDIRIVCSLHKKDAVTLAVLPIAFSVRIAYNIIVGRGKEVTLEDHNNPRNRNQTHSKTPAKKEKLCTGYKEPSTEQFNEQHLYIT